MPNGTSVVFRTLEAGHRLTTQEKQKTRTFAKLLAQKLVLRSFCCLLTNDEELRALNYRFLGHDYATDVLSFPSEGGGELAISVERAATQASEMGHSRMEEIKILALHGALHLIGLNHENDVGEMAERESAWRKEFSLPVGLIERAETAIAAK